MTQIRMNVDDIEGTVKMLEEKGFKNTLGRIVDQGSSVNAQMMGPGGFFITVIHHVKKKIGCAKQIDKRKLF